MSNFYQIQDVPQFQDLMKQDLQRVSVLNFWAPWAQPCAQMNEVFRELANKYERVLFLQIEAEVLADIAESFEIDAVPAFIVLRGHALLGRVSGADAAGLTNLLAIHAHSPPQALSKTSEKPAAPVYSSEKEETPEQLNAKLKALMEQAQVVLFMKGSPEQPQCGFSRKIVALLQEQGVQFKHFDILKDESVRQGLKVYNQWPTFPQLIIKGELVGGLDIAKEMAENGELQELLKA